MRRFIPFYLLILASFHTSCSFNEKDKVKCLDDPQLFNSDWFTDEELDMPYFLVHFCSLANAVIMDGEHKGFIDIPVWRHEKDNKPYNARIMENIYSLSYFYTTDRPWNPYLNNRSLRKRIENALEFWSSIQSEEGQFSEYKVEGWNLAATAFATKFIGEALILLTKHGGISDAVMENAFLSMREAILNVLKDPEFYDHGRSFTNQYTNVWSGALAYLSLRDDVEVHEALKSRILQSLEEFQSPAGYFYESDGPDWNYNLGTHENNLMMTWPYVKGTELEEIFKKKYEDFMQWVSINATPEPGFNTWYLNGGISTRTAGYYMENKGLYFNQSIPIAEISSLAYPYLQSREEFNREANFIRNSMREGTLQIADLEIGEFSSFSPYGLLHRNLQIRLPEESQKKEVIKRLPFLENTSFFEQRTDSRLQTTFTFIRKPAYYAVFNSGEMKNQKQNFGLGILWHPEGGTFIQPRVIEPKAAWGTSSGQAEKVFESNSFYPEFHNGVSKLSPQPGIQTYRGEEVAIKYILPEGGEKSLIFKDNELLIRVTAIGEITEKIPFLHDCAITINQDSTSCQIEKNGVVLHLHTKGALKITLQTVENEPAPEIQSVQLEAGSPFEYVLSF
jgi:hypothetical protein